MEGLINKILSRHLISYARDEKWLHDLMDGKKDRSQLYKKAMKHYILTAGDIEFIGVEVPGVQRVAPIIEAHPAQYNHYYDAPKKYEEEQIEAASPEEITADASEIMNIIGGL